MTFFNILVGVINILMLIFLLFPSSLREVLKMDPYKLGVMCVFIACLMYWIYLLIIFIKQRNEPKRSMNLESVQVIRNPEDGAIYLVDGNTCSHIPDMPTFNYLKSYFGFASSDVEAMLPDEMKRRFTIRGDLPSIKLHLPKPEP